MSQLPPDDGGMPEELTPFEPTPPEEMEVEVPRREASFVLREMDDATVSEADSMEAANRSLADALRIVYRLLQGVMIILAALFAFSGFQQVNEGEMGIKTALGRITDSNLEPGFHFALPYPLGEIIKIERGQRTVYVHDAFWPALTESQQKQALDDLRLAKRSLAPDIDGSLLTADGGLVLIQWSLTYHREDPAEFMSNIAEDHEDRLIRAGLQQATVRIAAQSTVDDILRPTADDGGGVSLGVSNRFEERVRREAQAFLERHESGLQIDSLSLHQASPPFSVREAFNQVIQQQATSARLREEAQRESTITLNQVAGTANGPLLALLDAYEAAVDDGDSDEATRLLGTLFDVFNGAYDGKPLVVGDQTFENFSISGDAANIVSDARSYRRTVTSNAQAARQRFLAKMAQFEANPRVFVTTEFTDAFVRFVNNNLVQQFVLPRGSKDVRIMIGPDQEIARNLERAIFEGENRRTLEQRLRQNRGRATESEIDTLMDLDDAR
ncbi:MAG: SPFH domain-containing protein [Phycisphaerales bacterium]